MKNLFYYLFGVITALYGVMCGFNLIAEEVLDDYYMNLLTQNYAKEWFYSHIGLSIIFALFVIIFFYNLGKSSNEKEPLLKKNDAEME